MASRLIKDLTDNVDWQPNRRTEPGWGHVTGDALDHFRAVCEKNLSNRDIHRLVPLRLPARTMLLIFHESQAPRLDAIVRHWCHRL